MDIKDTFAIYPHIVKKKNMHICVYMCVHKCIYTKTQQERIKMHIVKLYLGIGGKSESVQCAFSIVPGIARPVRRV